jgi:2-keto-3-deoxy-L-rhamnonate aldolase RhmA
MKPAALKAALKAKTPVFGFMISATASMRWGRVFAGSTLDFVVIDSEHGSRDRQLIADTVALMQSHLHRGNPAAAPSAKRSKRERCMTKLGEVFE